MILRYKLASPLCILFTSTADAAVVDSRLPRPLGSYADGLESSLWTILQHRVAAEPFNLVATVIFVLAICHTLFSAKFRGWAHGVEEGVATKRARSTGVHSERHQKGQRDKVSFPAQILYFLSEVEVVFGLWAVVLAAAIGVFLGWGAVVDYIGHKVDFTEPMFIAVVMAIADTRPVLRVAEAFLRSIATLGQRTTGAWWLAILIVAPLLGSLITEPAAMTIGALLLAQQFYVLRPSPRFAHATLGLLFVNVSVGGTLTHFAAPPVLMVAGAWGWNTRFMFLHFGWRAVLGIVIATAIYYLSFRRELAALDQERRAKTRSAKPPSEVPVPVWITVTQVGFMAFIVLVAHYPPLFIAGFLFFLAFSQVTAEYQGRLDVKAPLLVGVFLAGLVIHGGLQGWWIEPVLRRLGEVPLFAGATVLTAFNDNAAITYLATLVPGLSDAMKHAVVAGAVTGGGLTVIANAPNPAGQAILRRFFPDGISAFGLLVGAIPPTIVLAACFILF